MRTHTEEGGWYGDNTLEGDWTSLHRDSHIIQNGKRIELCKDGNVLQLVTKRWNDQVLIAGQGQKQGSGCWLYIDGEWIEVTSSFGTFCCAFGLNALYCVSGENEYRIFDYTSKTLSKPISRIIGVNGIRYINLDQSFDGIMTGDVTYGPVPYNISQWTLKGDIVVGQSYDNDKLIAAILKGKTYLLDSGNNKFIRFARQGDNLAITSVKQEVAQTIFYWLTINELREFPGYTPPTPEKPKPVPEPQSPPNRIETVKRMLRLHPEIEIWDEHKRGKIVDYFINAEGGVWGRKARNKDGSNKNTDATVWPIPNDSDKRFFIVDILAGVEWDKSKSDGGINSDRTVYATWDLTGPFKPGENGWWAKGEPINGKEEPEKEPELSFPTLHQWTKEEYPQLLAAYKSRHNNNEPDHHEWPILQTCRRYGFGLAVGEKPWTFEQMLAHELSQ